MMYNIHRLTRFKGKVEFIPCQGEEVEIEGYIFYLVKQPESDQYWLIEKRTGMSVMEGSKSQCKKGFTEKLLKVGIEKFQERINQTVENYGESPSYQRV